MDTDDTDCIPSNEMILAGTMRDPPALPVSFLPLPDLSRGRHGACRGVRSNLWPLVTHQVLATARILLSAIARGAVSCSVPSPGHVASKATSPPVSWAKRRWR